MKVVAFNGSPRREGNTARLIRELFKPLEEQGIECELVNLSGEISAGCTACMKCREKRDGRCAVDTDGLNVCLEKMVEADGIVIGSPTYFAALNAETKALIDRAGYASKGQVNNPLRLKVGAAVVAVRRAGALNVFQAINNFFFINEMIVPGSTYWNLGLGKASGDVEQDEEGLRTMQRLGENMAWLLRKIKAEP